MSEHTTHCSMLQQPPRAASNHPIANNTLRSLEWQQGAAQRRQASVDAFDAGPTFTPEIWPQTLPLVGKHMGCRKIAGAFVHNQPRPQPGSEAARQPRRSMGWTAASVPPGGSPSRRRRPRLPRRPAPARVPPRWCRGPAAAPVGALGGGAPACRAPHATAAPLVAKSRRCCGTSGCCPAAPPPRRCGGWRRPAPAPGWGSP